MSKKHAHAKAQPTATAHDRNGSDGSETDDGPSSPIDHWNCALGFGLGKVAINTLKTACNFASGLVVHPREFDDLSELPSVPLPEDLGREILQHFRYVKEDDTLGAMAIAMTVIHNALYGDESPLRLTVVDLNSH